MLLKCVFRSQWHSCWLCSTVTCSQVKEGLSHFLSLLLMSPKQGNRRADLHPVVAQTRLLLTESKRHRAPLCLDSRSCRYVVLTHVCKQHEWLTAIFFLFFTVSFLVLKKKKENYVTYNNVCVNPYCTFYNGAIKLVLCFLRVQYMLNSYIMYTNSILELSVRYNVLCVLNYNKGLSYGATASLLFSVVRVHFVVIVRGQIFCVHGCVFQHRPASHTGYNLFDFSLISNIGYLWHLSLTNVWKRLQDCIMWHCTNIQIHSTIQRKSFKCTEWLQLSTLPSAGVFETHCVLKDSLSCCSGFPKSLSLFSTCAYPRWEKQSSVIFGSIYTAADDEPLLVESSVILCTVQLNSPNKTSNTASRRLHTHCFAPCIHSVALFLGQ